MKPQMNADEKKASKIILNLIVEVDRAIKVPRVATDAPAAQVELQQRAMYQKTSQIHNLCSAYRDLHQGALSRVSSERVGNVKADADAQGYNLRIKMAGPKAYATGDAPLATSSRKKMNQRRG